MTRSRWSRTRLAALFLAHDGRCHICGGKIGPGEAWDLEHRIPLALGGEDDEANCAPAHRKCHAAKTAADIGQIAKSKRVRAKHIGARAQPIRPLPGGKKSQWKQTIAGGWVRRGE